MNQTIATNRDNTVINFFKNSKIFLTDEKNGGIAILHNNCEILNKPQARNKTSISHDYFFASIHRHFILICIILLRNAINFTLKKQTETQIVFCDVIDVLENLRNVKSKKIFDLPNNFSCIFTRPFVLL